MFNGAHDEVTFKKLQKPPKQNPKELGNTL